VALSVSLAEDPAALARAMVGGKSEGTRQLPRALSKVSPDDIPDLRIAHAFTHRCWRSSFRRGLTRLVEENGERPGEANEGRKVTITPKYGAAGVSSFRTKHHVRRSSITQNSTAVPSMRGASAPSLRWT